MASTASAAPAAEPSGPAMSQSDLEKFMAATLVRTACTLFLFAATLGLMAVVSPDLVAPGLAALPTVLFLVGNFMFLLAMRKELVLALTPARETLYLFPMQTGLAILLLLQAVSPSALADALGEPLAALLPTVSSTLCVSGSLMGTIDALRSPRPWWFGQSQVFLGGSLVFLSSSVLEAVPLWVREIVKASLTPWGINAAQSGWVASPDLLQTLRLRPDALYSALAVFIGCLFFFLAAFFAPDDAAAVAEAKAKHKKHAD